MQIIDKIKLGEVEFYGQIATVFREIYNNGDWKFVIVLNNERIVMLTY